MPTTAVAQIPYPDRNTKADLEQIVGSVAQQVDRYIIGRFTTSGERDLTIPGPVQGMCCTLAGKFMVYDGSSWVSPNPARRGAGVSLTSAQAISAATLTSVGAGAATWTLTENVGGAATVVGTAGTTEPITLTMPGLYAVVVQTKYSASGTTRCFTALSTVISAVVTEITRSVWTTDSMTSAHAFVRVAAGQSVGLRAGVYASPAGSISSCSIEAYRISD